MSAAIPLNRVRRLVAVRTFADWDVVRPGFMEVGLVTHSGPKAVGSFVHTLVLTDVASCWTECSALPVRKQMLIEMTNAWVVTGDDAVWVYTSQTYDWKGRPLLAAVVARVVR